MLDVDQPKLSDIVFESAIKLHVDARGALNVAVSRGSCRNTITYLVDLLQLAADEYNLDAGRFKNFCSTSQNHKLRFQWPNCCLQAMLEWISEHNVGPWSIAATSNIWTLDLEFSFADPGVASYFALVWR